MKIFKEVQGVINSYSLLGDETKSVYTSLIIIIIVLTLLFAIIDYYYPSFVVNIAYGSLFAIFLITVFDILKESTKANLIYQNHIIYLKELKANFMEVVIQIINYFPLSTNLIDTGCYKEILSSKESFEEFIGKLKMFDRTEIYSNFEEEKFSKFCSNYETYYQDFLNSYFLFDDRVLGSIGD